MKNTNIILALLTCFSMSLSLAAMDEGKYGDEECRLAEKRKFVATDDPSFASPAVSKQRIKESPAGVNFQMSPALSGLSVPFARLLAEASFDVADFKRQCHDFYRRFTSQREDSDSLAEKALAFIQKTIRDVNTYQNDTGLYKPTCTFRCDLDLDNDLNIDNLLAMIITELLGLQTDIRFWAQGRETSASILKVFKAFADLQQDGASIA